MPTGGFAHSFGLETAIQEGRIGDVTQLGRWLQDHLNGSLFRLDALAVAYVHGVLDGGPLPPPDHVATLLQNVDCYLAAAKLSRESRNGAIKIAKRHLALICKLYPESGLERYASWVFDERCHGSAAITHAWLCVFLREELTTTLEAFLYASLNVLVQNAQRALAIGQTAAQQCLLGLMPSVRDHAHRLAVHSSAEPVFASGSFVEEICAMRHETLYSRLFMS